MPEGGKIEIDVKEIFTEALQEGIANTENPLGEKCVCICVTDTGKGMNDDVLARAIEPFYTTSTNQGTGLGLSIAHGIVEEHGGTIKVDSKPGAGTTFRVLLPKSQPDA